MTYSFMLLEAVFRVMFFNSFLKVLVKLYSKLAGLRLIM